MEALIFPLFLMLYVKCPVSQGRNKAKMRFLSVFLSAERRCKITNNISTSKKYFHHVVENAYFCTLKSVRVMCKKQQDIAYFLSFCTEQYKNEKHLSGGEAVEVLGKYGVLDYLADHYEMLHTQGRQWLMEDIDEYIALRRKEA